MGGRSPSPFRPAKALAPTLTRGSGPLAAPRRASSIREMIQGAPCRCLSLSPFAPRKGPALKQHRQTRASFRGAKGDHGDRRPASAPRIQPGSRFRVGNRRSRRTRRNSRSVQYSLIPSNTVPWNHSRASLRRPPPFRAHYTCHSSPGSSYLRDLCVLLFPPGRLLARPRTTLEVNDVTQFTRFSAPSGG